jgi:hypothetical protein
LARCSRCDERIEVFGSDHAAQEALKMGGSPPGELPLDPEPSRHRDLGEAEAYAAESLQKIADAVQESVPATTTMPIL